MHVNVSLKSDPSDKVKREQGDHKRFCYIIHDRMLHFIIQNAYTYQSINALADFKKYFRESQRIDVT